MTEIQNIFKMSEIFVQEKMDTAADKLKNISRKADEYITNFIINNSDENGLISTDITGLDEDLDVNEIIHGNSATLPIFSDFAGTIIDALDSETKDGAIGATKQGATGDCWLLSGVNALSYTEKGREIIKDALEYTDDGVIVHLKGVGDYEVSNHEIAQTKASYQYSDGDDDMIVFELAIEKVLNDIANKDILFKDKGNGGLENAIWQTKLNYSSTEGGCSEDAFNIITGKNAQTYWEKQMKIHCLDEFQQNNSKDIALAASVSQCTTATDINGEKITLQGPHAYAVKSVDDNNVTFTNPHDSSIEYTVSKETFAEKFDWVTSCNLSENNPENIVVEKPIMITENGDKIFCRQTSWNAYTSEEAIESMESTPMQGIEIIAYSKDGEFLDGVGVPFEKILEDTEKFNNFIKDCIENYSKNGSFPERNSY